MNKITSVGIIAVLAILGVITAGIILYDSPEEVEGLDGSFQYTVEGRDLNGDITVGTATHVMKDGSLDGYVLDLRTILSTDVQSSDVTLGITAIEKMYVDSIKWDGAAGGGGTVDPIKAKNHLLKDYQGKEWKTTKFGEKYLLKYTMTLTMEYGKKAYCYVDDDGIVYSIEITPLNSNKVIRVYTLYSMKL
jgi:hypothetical protein